VVFTPENIRANMAFDGATDVLRQHELVKRRLFSGAGETKLKKWRG